MTFELGLVSLDEVADLGQKLTLQMIFEEWFARQGALLVVFISGRSHAWICQRVRRQIGCWC